MDTALLLALGSAPISACGHAQATGPRETERVVLTGTLSSAEEPLQEIKAMEVSYGPGGASPPHSHGCHVLAYITQGALRSQLLGEPERTYQAGTAFLERPEQTHLVSANARTDGPARFLAVFICQHGATKPPLAGTTAPPPPGAEP